MRRCITWVPVISLVLANSVTFILAVIDRWDPGTLPPFTDSSAFQSFFHRASDPYPSRTGSDSTGPHRLAWTRRQSCGSPNPISTRESAGGRVLLPALRRLPRGVPVLHRRSSLHLRDVFLRVPGCSCCLRVFFVNHLISSLMFRQTRQVGFSELFSVRTRGSNPVT